MMVTDRLKDRAEQARFDMTKAVYEYVAEAGGATNAEVARALGLQSSSLGGQQNHLTHALLADLVRAGRLTCDKDGSRVIYTPKQA